MRERVDAHLATCERCAEEVTALGDVRAELGLWVPPDVELGFTITKEIRTAIRNGAASGAVVERGARLGAGRGRRARDRRRRGHREPAGAIGSRRLLRHDRVDDGASPERAKRWRSHRTAS